MADFPWKVENSVLPVDPMAGVGVEYEPEEGEFVPVECSLGVGVGVGDDYELEEGEFVPTKHALCVGVGDDCELEEGEFAPWDSKNFSNTKENDLWGNLVFQLPVDSSLPVSAQMKDPAKSQASLISKSSHRTFLAGCSSQSRCDMVGGCQKSVPNSAAKTPGGEKSFGEHKTQHFVIAKRTREEVIYQGAFKESWKRNTTRIEVSECVVRNDLGGKLKEKDRKGSSFMPSCDRVIKSSILQQGSKSVTISDDISTERNSFGKYAEGSQLMNSTLPISVQLKHPAKSHASLISESMSLYKRRSVSTHRTFPAGCRRQSLCDTLGGCQKSVPNSIPKTLGGAKSLGEKKTEQFARANNKWRREEVRYQDAFKDNFERNTAQGTEVSGRVVRNDLDDRLRQKDTMGISFMPSLDRVNKSYIQEQGSKSITISSDMSTKRNSFGMHVEGSQNPPRVLKYCVVKPSTGRVSVQAFKAASPKFLSRLGKQKGIAKYGLVVGNPSNYVSRISRDMAEVDFFGHNEDDSPSFKRSRYRKLSSTPFDMNTFSDKDVDILGGVTRVKDTLRLFQTICRRLLQKGHGRVDLMAATELKEKNKCLNAGMKILGPVPGVKVGDEFRYRVELTLIGLHCHYEKGIDYINRGGKILATSIVVSGGYGDFMKSSNVLVYSGEGGKPTRGAKVATDQKLVRGNLALRNSMKEQTHVRVIRRFKEAKDQNMVNARTNMAAVLIYDGLYLVQKYWQQEGSHGKSVFMFQLERIPGQPELAIKELESVKEAGIREGICEKDLSHGKERIPIGAVNTIDDEKPPTFVYLAQMKHSVLYNTIPSEGCQCKGGCFGSMECSCAVKSGGQIPYNYDGALVEPRPLVYECGPKCQCPPSCRNRVSQHGIKFPLELFKTDFKGWGVRSMKFIPSGSFICEYTGEFIEEKDAAQRIGNDEYLFDVGHNYNDHALLEGLSDLIPSELQSSSLCESVEDAGFTIDAVRQGNIGRFINHSCSPNLYAHNVLFDHHDKRMPHIMLFAADNIPPLEELTFHYNMAVDQVRDHDGNIKIKECYCGSSECRGRIY